MLIIGDGIQEGVEELTAFLQLHAGLHTSLALIDLSIWRIPDGGQLVVHEKSFMRDAVKKEALRKAGVPLLEVPVRFDRD